MQARSPLVLAAAALAAVAAVQAQGPPGMMRAIPLIAALDQDASGTLSATEMRVAPAALAALDVDGSKVLTIDELMPAFGPGRGGPRGTGQGGRGGPGRGGPPGMPRRLPLLAALDADSNSEISEEEIRAAAASLQALDGDGSGSLEAAEFMPAFGGRGRFPGGGRPPLASIPVIAALDADSSGEISAAELSAATSALQSLDANRDGLLGAEEMLPAGFGGGRRGAGQPGPPGGGSGPGRGGGPGAPRGRLPVLQALDLDGSGAVETGEMAAAAASLATLDADSSGSLTPDEMLPRFGPGRGGRGGEPTAPLRQPHELEPEEGVAAIPDRETFKRLSYQGNQVMIDSGLIGLEFVKFVVTGATAEDPKIYFQHTGNYRAHPQFMREVGIAFGGRGGGQTGTMRGVLVYRPLLTAPDGRPGLYTFEFQPRDAFPFEMVQVCRELLERNSPLLAGKLAYFPLPAAMARYETERARYDDARLPVLREDELLADISYLPLNEAEGFGRLRLMQGEDRPGQRDIVLYKSLPNEMPRVAGVITAVRQTPLSHVNLRAVQDGVPNAFVKDAAANESIAALLGKYVYLKVAEDGYEIREASADEVNAHFADLRPADPPSLPRDLSVTAVRSLDEIGFEDSSSVGVKAANLATLRKLDFPEGVVPAGYAIPFHFYDAFMRHNGLYAEASAMIARPGFAGGADIRERELKRFRRAVKDGEVPAWMASALSELHEAFPKGQPVRLRSSTNNEDLPGFSGAGLYDSFTHHPDEGHIAKSVKQVFASLWNFRAFEEREFFRVDHLRAAMGILVHPNYSGELANGVGVTEDIVYQTGGYGRARSYYVNAQVGEDLVTNPEGESSPEEFLLSPRDAAGDRFIRSSNRSPGGSAILSASHRDDLRAYLATVHEEFGRLYGHGPFDRFAMEIEFKVTAEGRLAVKQARPWVFR